MMLKVKGKQVPTKNSLKEGESIIVELKRGQYDPSDAEGLFLYTRVGDKLYRSNLEEVEWRQ